MERVGTLDVENEEQEQTKYGEMDISTTSQEL